MKRPIMRQVLRATACLAIPTTLQCCAPASSPGAPAYGENVSYYFESGFTCPERLPAWRQLGDTGAATESTPYNQSASFEKALADLGARTRVR